MAKYNLTFFQALLTAGLVSLVGTRLLAAPADPQDCAPSKEKVQWLGCEFSQEFLMEYNYIGKAETDLGAGQQGDITEHYVRVRDIFSRRSWRAVLFQSGFEWQRYGFSIAQPAFIPDQMDAVNVLLGADVRLSRKDLIHVHAHPGFYSDFEDIDSRDFNTPFEVGYAHMVSDDFQWFGGLSFNTWRRNPVLPGAGFRWQINDRWKLKFILPEPKVEYKVKPDLNVFAGADLKGGTFRMSKNFGTQRGQPAFDNALLDYQEVRVGAGFSWNIKPLLELNMHSGFMVNRSLNYHDVPLQLYGSGGPYVAFSVQMLFELPNEKEKLDVESGGFQIPDFQPLVK